MKKVFVAAAAAVLMLNQTGALAENNALYTVYDFGEDTLTVSGNVNSFKALMTFIILPETVSIDNLSPEQISRNKYVTYELRNESDGSFSFTIQMPFGTMGGRYNVYAYCDDIELISQFSYVSESEVQDVVTAINAASASSAVEILKNNSETVGIADDCVEYITELAKMIKSTQPAGGFTADSFMEELNRSSAITLLKNGAELEGVMRSYGQSFGAGAQSEIASMNDTVKESFISYVKANSINGSTQMFFYRSVLMGYVMNASSYADMSTKLLRYQSPTGLSCDLSKATTDTYKKLFDSNPKTFESLQSTLNSLLSSQSSSGSGSGGGGGGTVSGGATSSGSSGGGSVATTSGSNAAHPGNVSPVQPGTGADGQLYTDIREHWCKENVERLSGRGIISGYDDGSFKPDNPVTRAEFTKLIVSALGIKLEGTCDFTDVSEDAWYYGYVSAGVENGLINGYGDNFRPEALISRQEAAVIIFRAIGEEASADTTNVAYKDAEDIADYAYKAVAALTEKGLLSGDGEHFAPLSSTTRAEAAAMIDRLLNYIENRGD